MGLDRINPEYIEDRSINKASDDSFRHEDVVDELAELALHGPAPSNIALFAPWGTGKSGIAKLLKPRVKEADQRFVYFDAFKHRETPLRRSFLRTAVNALDRGSLESIDTKLYGERVTQTLNKSDKWKLFWMIVGGVIGALLFAGIVSLGLSKLQPGPINEDFPGLFARTSGVLALVGGLLGVALTSLVNGYSVTKTSTPVAEDDEFEREFKNLVEGSKRVVVFIDELDRCSADDVVEALETMRVFLETANCVFVVAIDQQSLEQALRRKARQETPIDETHPYFSSTGSYIDKIFQYQIALPPLRARDMEGFVRDLVHDRAGLWQDLKSRDELQDVIGALAPTHVTSPRRIKVLLNSFVMAYHLAAKRIDAGEMSPLSGRAAALAKLVCLRTEFPLFAEDLDRFPELPQAILALGRGETDDDLSQEAPETWRRAKEFQDGDLPIAPLLFRPSAVRSIDGEQSDEEERVRIEKSVNGRHLANLLGYLGRVEPLPRITRDLVYLHSAAGSGTKLEPLTADRVEDAARDGSAERLKELLEDKGEVTGEVVRLLTSILAAAQPGSLDANNATHVLLEAIELSPELDATRAEDAADEIIRQRGNRELEDRDFAAAISLSVRCGARRGAALLSLVSESEDLFFTPPARTRLIQEYPQLDTNGRSLATQAVIRSIYHQQSDALDAVAALEPDIQTEMMGQARPVLKRVFEREVEEAEKKAANETHEEGAEQPQVDHKAVITEGWQEPLEAALDRFVKGAPAAAVQLTTSVMTINRRPLSDAVGSRLSSLAPIEDEELRRLALVKAASRPLVDRTAWLLPLAASDLNAASSQKLDAVAAATWSDVVDKGEDHGEAFENLLHELSRLAAPISQINTDPLDTAIKESFNAEAVDDPSSDHLEITARLIGLFVDTGLANRAMAQTGLASAFSGALSVVPGGDPSGRPNLSQAFAKIRPQLGDVDATALESLFERAHAAPSDTVGLLRAETMIVVATVQRQRGLEIDSDTVQQALLEQIGIDRLAAVEAATAWIGGGGLTANQLWAVLEPYWFEEIPGKLRQASMAAAQSLSEGEHQALSQFAFDHVLSNGVPNPANWEAIDLRGLSSGWVISELASRSRADGFDESGWRVILEICKQLTTGVAEAQRRIGEELLLPLAARDDSGYRLAVDHLGLVGKGKTGQAIIESFSELANTDDRKQLLSRQLGDDESFVKSLTKGLRKAIFGSSPQSPTPKNAEPKKTDADRDSDGELSEHDNESADKQGEESS
ncbi:MAG TPA: P-loop NTPase fold protein [Solirubrobacterales bacterium]|nr:P-loop NTPase fold protein [Solirubrobacterales bacterium]